MSAHFFFHKFIISNESQNKDDEKKFPHYKTSPDVSDPNSKDPSSV